MPAVENMSATPPTPTHAAYLSVRNFGALDGLRCLSIAAVVWHHYALSAVKKVLPASRYGFLGVDLFFVISGFLIVTLLLRERSRTGVIHLKQFYSRRSLRIFPLYYAVLGFIALKALVKGPHLPASVEYFEDLPILALYLINWIPGHQTFPHAWSLAAEEQFYVVWPPIEKYLRRYVLPIWLLLFGVGQLIQLRAIDGILKAWFGWGPADPGMLRQTTFTPILLGVALAHLLHSEWSFSRIAPLLGRRWAAPLILVALCALSNFFPADISGVWRPSVHVIMTALVGACVVREDHGLRALLSHRVLARLGQLSYGIYLMHHIGMDLGFKAARLVGIERPIPRLLVGVAAVYLVAEASYRLFELRFLRLRAKFRPSEAAAPANLT